MDVHINQYWLTKIITFHLLILRQLEKKINNYIKNKLNNRSSGGVKFDIFIVTKKEIISSDQKGDPLVFELTVV